MAGNAIIGVLARPPFTNVGRALLRGRASIFMLHRLRSEAHPHGHSIADVSSLVSELRRTGTHFMPLQELIQRARAGKDMRHAIAFTIDDGFADQAALARAFVAERVPVTVFLITGFLDGLNWPWDDQLAWAVQASPRPSLYLETARGTQELSLATKADREYALRELREHLKRLPQPSVAFMLEEIHRLTGVNPPSLPPAEFAPLRWDEVRALEREGVEFGAHSVTHRIFSRLTDEDARDEIHTSIRRLREELAHPSGVFCWPTGRERDFSARDIALLRDAGALGCVATSDDYANLAAGRADEDAFFRIKRFALPETARDALQYGTWIERAKQILRNERG